MARRARRGRPSTGRRTASRCRAWPARRPRPRTRRDRRRWKTLESSFSRPLGEAAFCGGEIRLTPTAPSERLQGQEPHGRQAPPGRTSVAAARGATALSCIARHERPLRSRHAPGVDDVEPCEHETLDRIITGTVTVVPVLCLLIVGWQVWGQWLGWNDIFVFLIMYVLTGLGITVGFHRMLTHRAFKTTPLGARRVHRARLGGDRGAGHLVGRRPPQAPRLLRPPGRPAQPARRPRLAACAARCAASRHAHVGWLFLHTHRGRRTRYAPDLLADPVVSADRPPLRAVRRRRAARAVLARLGVRRHAARRLHRPALGRRRARARAAPLDLLDQLALPLLRPPPVRRPRTSRATCSGSSFFTFGEAWHNNHHAFPTSAAHGLRRWEFDPSA